MPKEIYKAFKPPLTVLHKQGHINSAYLDDIYLQGNSRNDCLNNLIDTICLFTKLGFVIHPEKSSVIPSQEIEILGCLIKSIKMTVCLTQGKKEALKILCNKILKAECNSIEIVAKVIGKIVSCFPAVLYGPLYFRSLEYDKTTALKQSKGNFKANINVSKYAKTELEWWVNNIDKSFKPITTKDFEMVITTDASKDGWGAVCDSHATNGMWTETEKELASNHLEMLAVYFGLKCFASFEFSSHVTGLI